MDNPTYHLRPNKAVDRNLFVDCLIHLGKILDISNYRYIGFGSYEFDEFKLIYRALGIESLHSIEMNSDVFRRQNFNKPYSCIHLFNKTCSDYFDEDYDDTQHSIVWVDFSEANKKHSQCQDIANICNKMTRGDILRITFNANPTGISTGGQQISDIPAAGRKKVRFDALKRELNEFFPNGFNEEDLTRTRYPLLLLKTIKTAVYQGLDDDLSACPLCTYVYSDNTQMMTVTILIRSVEDQEYSIEKLSTALGGWESYITIGDWDKAIRIELPPLTVHEQLEIGQYEKDELGIKKIEEKMGITSNELKRYLRFARYYPNYQPVVI